MFISTDSLLTLNRALHLYHPDRRIPVFIDRDGAYCAVGYLVAVSGYTTAAHLIARQANNALIHDMQFPVLESKDPA